MKKLQFIIAALVFLTGISANANQQNQKHEEKRGCVLFMSMYPLEQEAWSVFESGESGDYPRRKSNFPCSLEWEDAKKLIEKEDLRYKQLMEPLKKLLKDNEIYPPTDEEVVYRHGLEEKCRTLDAQHSAVLAPLHAKKNLIARKLREIAINIGKRLGAISVSCKEMSLYVDPSYDITPQVINQLNKEYLASRK